MAKSPSRQVGQILRFYSGASLRSCHLARVCLPQAAWFIELTFNIKIPHGANLEIGLIGSFRGRTQIWGCERAVARSHPQIWDSTTIIPREPDEIMLKYIHEGKRNHTCSNS
jgi:hypothetical protein